MPRIPNELLEQARHADLVEYLRLHGYSLKQEGRSYRVSGYGGLIITGYKWSWKSQGIGGKAVDFLVNVLEMTLQEAVQELTGSNIPCLPEEQEPASEPISVGNFQLPERAGNDKRVIAYLCQQRKIQYNTVIKLIKAGKLYQDTRGNCVFVITDWDGKPVGAETHGSGTYSRYKNSTKHTGYGFRILCGSQPTGAMFFESAIDLLSYYQIFQKKLTHHYLISTAGTSNDRIIQLFHQTKPELKICLCCDNDQAGDHLIAKVKNEIDSGAFVHRPTKYEDWNEVLCHDDTPH